MGHPPDARRKFDVIAAGEAHWRVEGSRDAIGFRAGGGVVGASVALARAGLHVGLATALDDDSLGRALVEKLTARGVDTGGVTLTPARTDLVIVDGAGAANEVVSYRDHDEPFSVPPGWSSSVLLVSGLSPVVSIAGSLCRAARSARRRGAIVVVAIEARPHLWRGRDPRAIRMVLREADVVRCSAADLDVLGLAFDALRAELRPNAVVAMSNASGDAWVTGPFGEVSRRVSKTLAAHVASSSGDSLTAAICTELARAGEPGEDRVDLWRRALERGEAFASSARG